MRWRARARRPSTPPRERETILGIAHDELIDEAPGWVEPSPASHRIEGVEMTVDWLRRARDAGRVPDPGDIAPRFQRTFALRLGLVHARTPSFHRDCTVEHEPVELKLRRGDAFTIETQVYVERIDEKGRRSAPVLYHPNDGNGTLEVIAPALDLVVLPVGGGTFEWCW